MNERFFLGAYWNARKESLEQCALKLHGFLISLAEIDPALANWYEKGRSKRSTLARPVPIRDLRYFEQLLDRGRNRESMNRSVQEDLGFQIGLWNGKDDETASGLSVRCGLYWESTHPGVSIGNAVILDIPKTMASAEKVEAVRLALEAAVTTWNPVRAGVLSTQAMNTRAFDAEKTFVDWMVFVPRQIEDLIPPSSVFQIQGLGSIVVVQPAPTSAGDLEDIQRIHLVEDAISK